MRTYGVMERTIAVPSPKYLCRKWNHTACAISLIKCKHGFAFYRRLHKQLLEVYGKNLHSIFGSDICKVVSDLTLN